MTKRHSAFLSWQGKHEREPVTARLLCAESYGAPTVDSPRDMLVRGDNFAALHALQEDFAGKLRLIYIDPPFFSGKSYGHRSAALAEGLPRRSTHAYDDYSNSTLEDYLQMLYERLPLMRDLLAPDGVIYVHTDWHASHFIRLILDEVFGAEYFQNEIVWCYSEAINSKKRWNRKHDLIYFYSKGKTFTFNSGEVLEPHSESTIKKHRHRDENGQYRLMGRGITDSPIRSARDISPEWEKTHPGLTFRHYLTEGRLPLDYWHIDIVNQASRERTGYGTQKPLALLERVLLASTNPGDLVADFFCGSGTLAVAARKLGRKWIACDSSDAAISVARRRLIATAGTDSPDFDVMSLEGTGITSPASQIEFRAQRIDSETVSVEVANQDEDFLKQMAFWAVDADFNGEIFRPEWWSCAAKNRRVEFRTPSMKSSSQGRIKVLVSLLDATDFEAELFV